MHPEALPFHHHLEAPPTLSYPRARWIVIEGAFDPGDDEHTGAYLAERGIRFERHRVIRYRGHEPVPGVVGFVGQVAREVNVVSKGPARTSQVRVPAHPLHHQSLCLILRLRPETVETDDCHLRQCLRQYTHHHISYEVQLFCSRRRQPAGPEPERGNAELPFERTGESLMAVIAGPQSDLQNRNVSSHQGLQRLREAALPHILPEAVARQRREIPMKTARRHAGGARRHIHTHHLEQVRLDKIDRILDLFVDRQHTLECTKTQRRNLDRNCKPDWPQGTTDLDGAAFQPVKARNNFFQFAAPSTDIELMPLGKILLIEDTPSNSRIIEVTLRQLGFEIIIRADGESGLEAAHDPEVKAIVLDIALPKLNGWQVLEAIRADQATMTMPVLVLTAHVDNGNMIRAADRGADAFMTKPFQPDDLRYVVNDLIENHSQTKAYTTSP